MTAARTLNLLQAPSIRTSSLTWDSESRRFLADASDLPTPGQVWNDACDLGFTLVGRGGERVPVVASDEKHDDEGDLLYTDYLPVDSVGRALLARGLRVFND